MNSGFLDGLADRRRRSATIDRRGSTSAGSGARTVTYKLRDWLFSRQRYWGEPFPVLHLEDGSVEARARARRCPLALPELDDFKPDAASCEPPLARAREWLETTDPATGAPGAPRHATRCRSGPGAAGTTCASRSAERRARRSRREAERYWMPVDLYVGGAEHAVLHLLYARFWHKVLYDLGLVHTTEPFQKLREPGHDPRRTATATSTTTSRTRAAGAPRRYPAPRRARRGRAHASRSPTGASREGALGADRRRCAGGPDGSASHAELADLELEEVIEKMSKSRGNVVNPDDVIAEFGADSMRLYEMFIGPLDKGAPWSTEGIPGVARFLQRAWRLLVRRGRRGRAARGARRRRGHAGAGASASRRRSQGVTRRPRGDALQHRDLEADGLRARHREGRADRRATRPRRSCCCSRRCAPHLAEELWQQLGHGDSIAYAPWPVADPALLVADTRHARGAGERQAARRDRGAGRRRRRQRSAPPRSRARTSSVTSKARRPAR